MKFRRHWKTRNNTNSKFAVQKALSYVRTAISVQPAVFVLFLISISDLYKNEFPSGKNRICHDNKNIPRCAIAKMHVTMWYLNYCRKRYMYIKTNSSRKNLRLSSLLQNQARTKNRTDINNIEKRVCVFLNNPKILSINQSTQ